MPKKKKLPASRPIQMRWEFDPDIPTDDFFEGRNLDELWDLQEAVDNFVCMINDDAFLTWEQSSVKSKAFRSHPGKRRR